MNALEGKAFLNVVILTAVLIGQFAEPVSPNGVNFTPFGEVP